MTSYKEKNLMDTVEGNKEKEKHKRREDRKEINGKAERGGGR